VKGGREGEKEGRGGERMWRGPESGLPRGPCWLSAGLNIAMTFGMGKLEWCGYPMVKKIEDVIRFDRIHERDRRTKKHTQTDT